MAGEAKAGAPVVIIDAVAMDHKSFVKTLNAEQKARLSARSDAHVLRHLMVYCALIGATGS
jgi:hypothetical protein